MLVLVFFSDWIIAALIEEIANHLSAIMQPRQSRLDTITVHVSSEWSECPERRPRRYCSAMICQEQEAHAGVVGGSLRCLLKTYQFSSPSLVILS